VESENLTGKAYVLHYLLKNLVGFLYCVMASCSIVGVVHVVNISVLQ